MNPFCYFHAWGNLTATYVPTAFEHAELCRRKRLLDAAARGNEKARRILRTDYHLTRWEQRGQAVIEGAR